MMLKKYIKNLPAIIYLRREYWRKRGKKEFSKYSDYDHITKLYKKKLGRDLNITNPKRYTEKLQWLKVFWRNDDASTCSDKYMVREYLQKRGYGYLLNDLIAVYDDVSQLDPNALPNQFVLKASHGSGWNMIVKDKSKVKWFWWKKIMRSWLKQNLYWFGREWNYEKQTPRIVVERYLEDDSGELRDYKLFCINGKPSFFQIHENRATNHKCTYIDCEGNRLPIHENFDYGAIDRITFSETQRKMVEIAKDLCKPFPFVRVDFYECNGNIRFGEMTFFPDSGFISFTPDEWDYTIGEMLILPEPNHNLELFETVN